MTQRPQGPGGEPIPRSAGERPPPAREDRGWGARVARHPVITATLLVCTVGGAIAGALYLSGDWSLARRIAAGAVAGAGTGLLVTATKLFG